MIAVVIAEDGLHFRVMQNSDNGEVVEITDQYQIHPMAIEVDGKQIVGFHVGTVLPQPATPT